MSILYNKKAYLYKYITNENMVSSYSETWILFACNIQPVSTKDWIVWEAFLKTKKVYSDKQVEVGDKVVCDSISYIVNSVEHRDWAKRKYYKSFIVESNWN